MFNPNSLAPDVRAYFDSLPPVVQATLVHTGIDCRSRQELEIFSGSPAGGR